MRNANSSNVTLKDNDTILVFFFQAEDGIRDIGVTGIQTCALPICPARPGASSGAPGRRDRARCAECAPPTTGARAGGTVESTEGVTARSTPNSGRTSAARQASANFTAP